MSKRSVDMYVKFSKYNGGNVNANGSIQENSVNSDPNVIPNDRFNNAPPPLLQELQPQQMQQQQPHQSQQMQQQMQQQQPYQPQQQQPHQPQQHRVKELDSEKLFNLLSNQNYHYSERGPMKIMVKVYTDWCGPCKAIAPKIKELSMNPNYNDILFVSINGEKISENLKRYINVSSVPVFFGFVAGKQFGDYIVGPDLKKIVQLCNSMINIS
jgi:thioredoxin 1